MKATEQKTSRTYTTLFVLPQLGLKKEDIITDEFINAYLYHNDYPEEEGYVYLVYKTKVDKIPIPAELNYFMKLFYNGLYSKFLPSQKYNVLSFWGLSKHSRMSNILNPKDYIYELSGFNTMLYKKGEIWPKPSTMNETFISNQI